ncbi:MAG TPA: radical SAM family heme chaperone HemW [Terriglobia bacterium]|nr:radical SAM family heme chaperone HemW [Terriglobia bacterium]
MRSLGVYVQIPFCSSKCTFCNFSSKVAPASDLTAYLASLEREIDLLPQLACKSGNQDGRVSTDLLNSPVDSAYLGGGTPTLAGAKELTRLFTALRARFQFDITPEITIEMTPGSANPGLLAACRALGINRLSIGAQSFDDRELGSVGRLHSSAETIEQVRWAREAGFRNISLDLIAGLPHQTGDSWRKSLHQTLDLGPEHISIYLFEADEKSRLGNEVLLHGDRYHAATVPGEDFMAESYEQARELLREAGYVQYEISNFAQPGFESRHNRKYWRLAPYIGLGAGAHSFDGQARWSNEISTADYAARVAQGELPIVEWRSLPDVEQIEEFFFLGLRQQDGIDLASAESRWGRTAVDPWRPRIDSLVGDGLLEAHAGRLRLTPRAYLVSNEVFQEFVS